ncbi:hypothetical protein IQ235_08595 [Oscillatoriales cyanobacterium LEGE 11467]|uniref:Uncharacterized protein n=1 Tax=Zarconia navalis LEGE 11467 TaxID=1828826 RepID=A0A928VVC5_9CYAN|nr:hypothetical protein [Zarconia navalis]MBE9040836.1 hypothetical protein [Zarconia navalis LEGE 11467]
MDILKKNIDSLAMFRVGVGGWMSVLLTWVSWRRDRSHNASATAIDPHHEPIQIPKNPVL